MSPILQPCATCGKLTPTPRCPTHTRQVKQTAQRRLYTSRKARGKRTGSGPGWRALRRRVYVEQGRVCGRCAEPIDRYEVHHIDGDQANDGRENLIALCHGCHVAAG